MKNYNNYYYCSTMNVFGRTYAPDCILYNTVGTQSKTSPETKPLPFI